MTALNTAEPSAVNGAMWRWSVRKFPSIRAISIRSVQVVALVLDGGGEQREGPGERLPEPLGDVTLALGGGGEQLGGELARLEEAAEVQLVLEGVHVELGHHVHELQVVVGDGLQLRDEALDEEGRDRRGDGEHDQEEGGDGEDLQPDAHRCLLQESPARGLR